MSLEKLPVPTLAEIQLLTSDVGSGFQSKMNAIATALRNAMIAYNNQVDAALTASQQVEPAPLEVALEGLNNTYKVTPASLHHVIKKFGLGAIASRLDVLPNAAIANGWYSVPAEWEGSPYPGINASNQGTLITAKHADPAYGTQFFVSLSTLNEFLFRRIENNVVRPWMKMYHSGNAVGVVSQSGGLPSGAIIQRGSNVHGHFTIWADGTAEVWHTSANAYGAITTDSGLSYSTAITWEYPISFVGIPTTHYSAAELVGVTGVQTWAIGAGKLGANSPTTVNDYPIYVFFSRAGDYTYKINCFAKGRVF